MGPVRSSLGAGLVAAGALVLALSAAEVLYRGTTPFVFASLRSLCVATGQPYCDPGSTAATGLAAFWYGVLFVLAWPLLFAGFTWGLPGESGISHGAVYGLVLWAGYVVVVLYGIGFGTETVVEALPLRAATLGGYLVYGVVLGGVYDGLAQHRTLLSR
jgi:hypothetical protein